MYHHRIICFIKSCTYSCHFKRSVLGIVNCLSMSQCRRPTTKDYSTFIGPTRMITKRVRMRPYRESRHVDVSWDAVLPRILYTGILLWVGLMLCLCPAAEGRKEPKYPQPKFLPRLLNVTVREGTQARLSCAVHFLGTRQVTWRKIGGEHFMSVGDFKWVKDTNIELEFVKLTPRVTEWNILILNTSQQDSGVYQCQISAPKTLTQNIQLNVVGPPVTEKVDRPVIIVTGKNYVDQGQPIHLYCNTTGPDHTHLRVDWFKDGDSIDNKDYRHIYVTNYNLVESKQLVSELYIDRSKASDSGTYICRSATNQISSKKVTVLFADTTNVKRGSRMEPTRKEQEKMNQADMATLSPGQDEKQLPVLGRGEEEEEGGPSEP